MSSQTGLQLVISCLTLLGIWMAGNKDMRFNYVGLLANVGWHIYSITEHAWGLVPLNIALLLVYLRNIYVHLKKDAKNDNKTRAHTHYRNS